MNCKHFQKLCGAAAFLILLGAASAWGQSPASLDGVVQDTSNAVIVGAQVDLTNAATGVVTSTKTSSSGKYVFPFVLPGSYSLSARRSGFEMWNGSAVLHGNEHIAVNITLTVGSVSQSVNVTATREGIQNDSGQRSETLTGAEIGAMSTEGTNTEDLLTLLPGVTSGGSSAYGSTYNAGVLTAGNGGGIDGFNINGNRNDANTIQLDGGNMDSVTSNGGGAIYPNTEFISEISVETSNFTADQGGSPVLVNAVTKSGTKDLHGEGFWVGRNYHFNANNWTNNYAGQARPQSTMNYPGFDISGPVLLPHWNYNRGDQKKLFFFLGIEWARQTPDYGTELADVPSAGMQAGNFSSVVYSAPCSAAFANGTEATTYYLNQPCDMSDPATGQFLYNQGGKLSTFTQNGVGLLTSMMGPGEKGSNYLSPNGQWNYAGHPLYPDNNTQYVGRFDWNPSDKARMFVRLGKENETQYAPWGEYSGINSTWTSNVPDPTPTISSYNNRALTFSIVSILSPTLTNEFTFNGMGAANPSHYQDPTLLEKSTLGVNFTGAYNNGYPLVPQIQDNFGSCDSLEEGPCQSGGGTPGQGRWGATNLVGKGNYNNGTTFDYKDNLTKVAGAHILKFGTLFGRGRNNQNMDAADPLEGLLSTSTWTSGSSGDEYADILTETFAEFEQSNHDVVAHMRSYSWEWYGQDSWKVRHNLTLEYGIRWTWQGPWYDVNGLGATFDPTAYTASQSTSPYDGVRTASCKNPGQSAVPLCGTIPKTIRPNGHPFTQPRIGFSWDPKSNGNTVLRGGFGEYTQRDPTNASFGAILGPPNLLETTLAQYEGYACCTLAEIQAEGPVSAAYTYGDSSGVYSKTDSKQPDIFQFNLTVDQRLPAHFLAEVAYVGSQSRHLQIEQNIDPIPQGTLWVPGTHVYNGDNLAVVAPYAPFTQIEQLQHEGNANYNALQTTLRRQATHSLDFIASYTYSKALGQSDEFEAPVPDPFSTTGSRHVLAFDRTNVFSIGYQYFIPGLPGGSAVAKSAIARGVVNGWMLSGITNASSGGPVAIDTYINCVQLTANGTPSTSPCASTLWNPADSWFGTTAWGTSYLPGTETASPEGVYPAFSCNPRSKVVHSNINVPFINTGCVTLPAFGSQGAIDPPYIKSPKSLNFNLSMQKSFPMGEERHLDVRVSSFDLTNRGQPAPINTVADFNWTLPYGATDPDQGTPTLTNGTGSCSSSTTPLGYSCEKSGNRQMEASAKFFF